MLLLWQPSKIFSIDPCEYESIKKQYTSRNNKVPNLTTGLIWCYKISLQNRSWNKQNTYFNDVDANKNVNRLVAGKTSE